MERQSYLTESGGPRRRRYQDPDQSDAAKRAEVLLKALPNGFPVVSEVIQELKSGGQAGRDDAAAVEARRVSGHLQVVQLGGAGMQHFASLVSGPVAQTLDDGEAATIACALELKPTPSLP